jgi:ribonucleoside-diphosphate reductase alpha subunit
MQVQKRNGLLEEVSFDKIKRRIRVLSVELLVDPIVVTQKVCGRIYNGVTTKELDELSSQICMSMITENLDYGVLGSRIIISNHHKNTSNNFVETVQLLYNNVDIHGKHTPIISEEIYNIVLEHGDILTGVIDYERDYNFDFFAFKTLERAYLLKINRIPVERIQDMFMRVSLGLHGSDIESAIDSYNLMSCKYFTHATPTLFHSGTMSPSLLSCFLLGTDDSIAGIYKNLGDCAQISKWAGGIGLHISNIRSKNVLIRGTNGTTSGIIPMLRVYNETMKYVNQCFTPDTIVYTLNGHKRVDKVKQGDQLITVDGTYQDVNTVAQSYKEDINILSFGTGSTLLPVKCTEEHDIYVVRNLDKIENMNSIKQKMKDGEYVGEYIKASNISLGDLVCYAIPRYVNIISECNDNRHDYMYMLGIMIDNGVITNGYCELNINRSHTKLIKFITKYLNTTSLINVNEKNKPSNLFSKYKNEIFKSVNRGASMTKYSVSDDVKYDTDDTEYDIINNSDLLDQSRTITNMKSADILDYNVLECNDIVDIDNIDNNDIMRIVFNVSDHFDINLVYNGTENYINPRLMHLTEYKIRGLLTGILCISERDNMGCNYSTGSYGIAHAIKYLFMRLDVLVSCYDHDGTYILNIPYNNNIEDIIGSMNVNLDINMDMDTYFEYNGKLYTKITEINNYNYSGYVYDFNMNNNHNYTTDLGVVHNSGKRNGSAAIYIEPHHPDIMEFLDLRKNHGNEDDRARDLFLAMWMSDLFMERVQSDSDWSLFDPDMCRGLNECYGDAFKVMYEQLELDGVAAKVVKARDVWKAITTSQIETGAPYIVFKDAANSKSNQQHYGVIKSSNLCAEILEYSDKDEYACCCLASIGLPMFIEDGVFNFDKLINVCMTVVKNLNKAIDINYYPVPETKKSNMLHRPLGIGIQGLADVFSILRMPFDSPEAMQLNEDIFESMYYGCLHASCALAQVDGAYPTFAGSPASQGRLQFDLWNKVPSDRYDWDTLKLNVMEYGLRNSLLVALMPTASTSQILGNNECFEPYTSNIYVRRTMAGDFIVINKYLVKDLTELGIWSSEVKDKIIAMNGSVKDIEEIPDDIKILYKTVWEIKQKVIIDMAIRRAPFVCQTQSMNLFFEEPTSKLLTNAIFYGWKNGLKTGIYYCRGKPKSQSQQFTIDPNLKKRLDKQVEEKRSYEDEICESCSA